MELRPAKRLAGFGQDKKPTVLEQPDLLPESQDWMQSRAATPQKFPDRDGIDLAGKTDGVVRSS